MNKVIYMAGPAMAAARASSPFFKEMGKTAGQAVVQVIAAQVAIATLTGIGALGGACYGAIRRKVRSARKTLATTIEPHPTVREVFVDEFQKLPQAHRDRLVAAHLEAAAKASPEAA